MHYKGFAFPADIALFPNTFGKIIYYYYQIRRKSPQDLLALLRNQTMESSRKGYIELEKMDRIIRFFLVGMLRYSRPCFIRSCILFEQAKRAGLNVEILIGVNRQDGQLKGHSWITIDGQPYRETAETVNEYTIMMKG